MTTVYALEVLGLDYDDEGYELSDQYITYELYNDLERAESNREQAVRNSVSWLLEDAGEGVRWWLKGEGVDIGDDWGPLPKTPEVMDLLVKRCSRIVPMEVK